MDWVGQPSLVRPSEGFLWMGLASQVADFVALSESFLSSELASQKVALFCDPQCEFSFQSPSAVSLPAKWLFLECALWTFFKWSYSAKWWRWGIWIEKQQQQNPCIVGGLYSTNKCDFMGGRKR